MGSDSAVRERVLESARRAAVASRALARSTDQERSRALLAIADALQSQAESLLAANAVDLAAARKLVEAGGMPVASFDRLKLSEPKLDALADGVRQAAAMADPLGRVTLATELDEGLRLFRVTCPVGVIGVVFESRPDALPQITALALKSGNAVLLKGGSEAERSNRALFDLVRGAAVSAGLPADALALLEGREEVSALLEADGCVDLIVPRGSGELVRYVQAHTRIPVLGHAEGVCHVYVDRAADLGKALAIVIDAKVQYPAACNSAETLLVHADVAGTFLPPIASALAAEGVELRCEPRALERCGDGRARLAASEDFGREFGDLVLAVRVVDSLEEAIEHIGRHSSKHTDAIVTEDGAAADRFCAEVDSAGVFVNASTRFADGYRYGFGAELGISTGKLHPRGPVGLDGLVTYKYKLVGTGQIVETYSGPGARRFTHRKLGY
jgi:glutamate-5-semialdehyde dehydrogenase